MSRPQFAAILIAGALLRAVALPWPGTVDVTIWKVWSYNASRRGVTGIYGIGGSPPEQRVLEYAGTQAIVNYPPLAIYELGLAGRIHRAWSQRRFPNSPALNVAIKLPVLCGDIGLLLLIWWWVKREFGETRAQWTAAAYWLNPAVLINGSVLGYLDLPYVMPAAASIAAAIAGWPALAGGLIAAAILTKPQALFVAPAVALGLWAARSPRRPAARFGAAAVGGLAISGLLVAPFAAAGAFANMVQAVGRVAFHETLSSQACNFWWLVGYILRVRYSAHDMGLWAAMTAPAQILGIPRVVELGYPDPKTIGIVLTASAIAWSLWTARRARDLWMVAAAGAFMVHAYATLSAQVHENHMIVAVPLLVLAAAGRPRLRPVAAAVSAIVALNHNLFYGFGNDVGYALPRAITVIDATVVVSLINCAVLGWHARVLRRECSTADAPRQQPAPA